MIPLEGPQMAHMTLEKDNGMRQAVHTHLTCLVQQTCKKEWSTRHFKTVAFLLQVDVFPLKFLICTIGIIFKGTESWFHYFPADEPTYQIVKVL